MRKLLVTAMAATMLVPVAASAQDHSYNHNRGEMRHDRGEVRHDRNQMRHDRNEARRDARHGRAAQVRHDRHQVRQDRREVRQDRREMRHDRRESWRDYRQAHRNVYRRGRYVGPRGYAYRPVTIGFRFAPAYYSQRYWVSDYGRYRLPPPGYGRRWIRYGNDVILINVRNGRVIQVYRGFFW